MAHADSFKSVINRFANSGISSFVVAGNQSDALDQWVALHLVKEEVGLYDSATCTDVTVWKELASSWKEFLAHVHFDCMGNGATYKKIFTVSLTPIPLGFGGLFYLAIVDWASPDMSVKSKGAVVPFTNNPGENRLTVKDVSPPSPPSDPADYDYFGNPSIAT